MNDAVWYRLFTPGPTPVPEFIRQRMSEPIIHHRSAQFTKLFREVTEGLKYLFQTDQDVLTFTASGTGGMEAIVSNLLSRDDRVITIEGGKFGRRWTEICRSYGIQPTSIKIPWGASIDGKILQNHLRADPGIQAVFLTHCETSTGAVTDMEYIARVIRDNSEALVVGDGISTIGALPFKMDEWGIDAAVAASQKGLMLPPGLAFVAVSPRAWKRVSSSDLPRYYFNLEKARQSLRKNRGTLFTPAITLLFGLHEALQRLHEEGIENVWQRHKVVARATREGIKALGLEILAQHPSDSVTVVQVPVGLDVSRLIELLQKKYGFVMAGGQEELAGKVFRIAHIGYHDRFELISLFSALEMVLVELKWKFKLGAGINAVQMVYQNSCRGL